MDPFARIAWLEQQNQMLFNDGAKQYAEVQRLSTALQNTQMERIASHEESISLAQEISRLLPLQEKLEKLTRKSEDERKEACRLRLALDAADKKNKQLEDENAKLKTKEPEKDDSGYISDGWEMYQEYDLFVPAKKRKLGEDTRQFVYEDRFGDFSYTTISDSESEDEAMHVFDEHMRKAMEKHWDLNLQQDTRLDPGAFGWLEEWCKDNLDRIEQLRAKERSANKREVSNLAKEKVNIKLDIRRLEKQIKQKNERKKTVLRKMLVLSDEEKLHADGGLAVEKKLFLFCKVMGRPEYDFRMGHYPFVKKERDLVMSAMKVLHEDVVEAPKRADKKFKHRNPSPPKWQVLQTRTDYRGRQSNSLEEQYVSNATDARMACTALQTMLWLWQEGRIG
ncbi:uncharacterized protein MYCFIDRAFT_200550 [Pseudocercospora fijiensis CIRAD86]|uniref:Uncharacterized protein n=1 Tax=Pseudocercospora fijiensis (strain CIRAD86) TaxID=383855 RepID=M2ZDP7_PSEFD|nr:uncharacterized protein MYCFIDRAFT_200550 [Pseudocercospora fijiensis CIRAD86]EME77219.1 hypothetical protein MYCFIDRAFT_200550 [Pseudocercospora fijiensis CIRAD86]